jgi:predicted nucleotide-binding protein (sugar kinase/HSP70/actin superfamily)
MRHYATSVLLPFASYHTYSTAFAVTYKSNRKKNMAQFMSYILWQTYTKRVVINARNYLWLWVPPNAVERMIFSVGALSGVGKRGQSKRRFQRQF